MPLEDDESLRTLLKKTRTIAVVGASDKPWRDSNSIASFLMERGYTVFPVNPGHAEILGVRCYPDLKSIPEAIDMVDVFRRPEAVPAVVDDAIAANAKSLWLQLGVIHEEAARKAEEHGLSVVMDRCIAIEHRRLFRR